MSGYASRGVTKPYPSGGVPRGVGAGLADQSSDKTVMLITKPAPTEIYGYGIDQRKAPLTFGKGMTNWQR